MNISLEKIEGEYRDGHFVSPLIKRVWLAELELLKEIDRICSKYDLVYYASWGTMLGAVRHKGFIPWDDDVDIEMPRRDYEIFRRVAPSELTGTMRLVDIMHDDVSTLFLKVISSSNRYRLDQDYLDRFHGCPYQLAVDIMCMDRIPDDETEAKYMATLAMQAYGLGQKWNEYEEIHREQQFRDLVEITGVKCPAGRSRREHCIYLMEMVSAMYMEDDCEYSATIYYYEKNPKRKVRTDIFNHITRVPFENTSIPVPDAYDDYLSTMFGPEYMKPVIWGKHPYISEAVESLRADMQAAGQSLPAEFDLTESGDL